MINRHCWQPVHYYRWKIYEKLSRQLKSCQLLLNCPRNRCIPSLYGLVITTINLRTTFEVYIFTLLKMWWTPKFKNRSRDPDHAHLGDILSFFDIVSLSDVSICLLCLFGIVTVVLVVTLLLGSFKNLCLLIYLLTFNLNFYVTGLASSLILISICLCIL